MRTKNEPDIDEAGRKCFFCGKPIEESALGGRSADNDFVLWISQHAISRNNRQLLLSHKAGAGKWSKGVVPTNSNSIVLHPACSIQLGQRLMADGFKGHKISFRASLAVLKMHLESHKGDPDE
jgi:hypothetical protein